MFSFLQRKPAKSLTPMLSVVKTLHTRQANLDNQFPHWLSELQSPSLILAYLSPHLDFAMTCRHLQGALQQKFTQCKLIAVSTAGELCQPEGNGSLYCSTGEQWDSMVLQAFEQTLVSRVDIVTISLGSHHAGAKAQTHAIMEALKQAKLPQPLDYTDTVALTFIDGLSGAESFFTEALYRSERMPCYVIGGSSGGKLDFQKSYLYDGQQVCQNQAVMAFLKVAPDYRYAIFTSHNFQRETTSFLVAEASAEERWIQTVLSEDYRVCSLIETLKQHFHVSDNAALEAKLQDYSFAIEIGGQLFIRSVSQIDFKADRVRF